MAYRALFGVATAALLSTGCDVSQKMPETGSLSTTTAIARPAGSAPSAAASSPEAAGEKSIRLFGPGVSRKRQTRV